MGEKAAPIPVYMFVIWSRGMGEADQVLGALENNFTILHQVNVHWRPCDYIKNFAAFYGWKGFSMWLGKTCRSGVGTFRVIFVRDEAPVYRKEKQAVPHEIRVNENVLGVKFGLRHVMRHSNLVHGSCCEAETRHNVRALFGEELETFLARTDLNQRIETLSVDKPLKYRPYPYAAEVGKGPRFLDGVLRFNLVSIFLFQRCGVPTIFSFSFRILSLFNFAFCLGRIKMGFRASIK